MLGDKAHHQIDIEASRQLLNCCRRHISAWQTCLDMAGGIGRVAKTLLTLRFDQVDLEELSSKYIKKAKEFCP
jgi:hypothetical protein